MAVFAIGTMDVNMLIRQKIQNSGLIKSLPILKEIKLIYGNLWLWVEMS